MIFARQMFFLNTDCASSSILHPHRRRQHSTLVPLEVNLKRNPNELPTGCPSVPRFTVVTAERTYTLYFAITVQHTERKKKQKREMKKKTSTKPSPCAAVAVVVVVVAAARNGLCTIPAAQREKECECERATDREREREGDNEQSALRCFHPMDNPYAGSLCFVPPCLPVSERQRQRQRARAGARESAYFQFD